MNREEARKRIGQLTEEINVHNHNYYDLSSPTITDYEFDILLEELIKLEKVKREELEKAMKQSGWGEPTALLVAAWNPFDVAGSAPFFDPEMMFGITDGFDIVIGNPPYIQIQSFSGRPQQKAWEQQKYATYTRTGDVYCLFYERVFKLLAQVGTLAYFSSNKWMRANYGKSMRKFFLQNGRIGSLIDFGDY